MAPRKEKADKAKVDSAADTIVTYLRKENRPYSANDVSANLHNKITKTSTAKILKELHERNEIEGRASGKQVVYHVKQDPSEAASAEELQAMSADTESLRVEISALRSQEKTLKSALSAISGTPSTAELEGIVSSFHTKKEELIDRLMPLRLGNVKPIKEEDRCKVELDLKKWEGRRKLRAKIRQDFWAVVKDGRPEGTDLEDFKDSLGLEGD